MPHELELTPQQIEERLKRALGNGKDAVTLVDEDGDCYILVTPLYVRSKDKRDLDHEFLVISKSFAVYDGGDIPQPVITLVEAISEMTGNRNGRIVADELIRSRDDIPPAYVIEIDISKFTRQNLPLIATLIDVSGLTRPPAPEPAPPSRDGCRTVPGTPRHSSRHHRRLANG